MKVVQIWKRRDEVQTFQYVSVQCMTWLSSQRLSVLNFNASANALGKHVILKLDTTVFFLVLTDRYSGVRLWPWQCGVGSLSSGEALVENIRRSKTWDFVGHHVLNIQSISSRSWNLCTALAKYKPTESSVSHNINNSPTKYTIALELNVFLTGIYGLPVINL